MADAFCGGYYSTEPNQAGGGGYWTASIELSGDFVVAEVYGDTADEVRERCAAFLSGIAASPPAREEAPAEGAGEVMDLFRAFLREFRQGSNKPTRAQSFEAGYALALRNRTSEPEAGEDEDVKAARERMFGGMVKVSFYDGNDDPQKTFMTDLRTLLRNVPRTHAAPATADKLKVAVEALERIRDGYDAKYTARQALAALNEGGE